MKKTSLRQKIILIIFGLFTCIILLEAGLRIGGFIILSIQEYRNQLSIRQKGEYRILCLGESTTAGGWPPLLEEILNQRDIGIKFSVIDKGRLGTNTGVIVSSLENNLDRYNPQMVVTMMGINDSGDAIPYSGIPDKKILLFFNSFRTYKLIKLLHLNIINKAKEKTEALVNTDDIKQPDNLKEQEQILKKAIKMNPEDTWGYLKLGEYYRGIGDHNKAKEIFKKAIEIDPEDIWGYLEVGKYYLKAGDYNKAKEMFKKTIEIDPENEWGYVELARYYKYTGEYDKAEESFKKAIKMNPEDTWGYLELGRYYKTTGDPNKAEEMFKKAVEIDPEDIWGYLEVGLYYRARGDHNKAKEMFKKAVEINPKNDRLNAALAVCYIEQGEYSLAEEYSKKAEGLRIGYYNPVTRHNYQRLKKIVTRRGIRLICIQYPMRDVEPLKRIFDDKKDIIFVDNEKLFKEKVAEESYDEYFSDIFGGDFGHCTEKGNRLLAKNIADTILKEYFNIEILVPK